MIKITKATKDNWYKIGEEYRIRDITKYSNINGIQVWRNSGDYNEYGVAPDIVMEKDCEILKV